MEGLADQSERVPLEGLVTEERSAAVPLATSLSLAETCLLGEGGSPTWAASGTTSFTPV